MTQRRRQRLTPEMVSAIEAIQRGSLLLTRRFDYIISDVKPVICVTDEIYSLDNYGYVTLYPDGIVIVTRSGKLALAYYFRKYNELGEVIIVNEGK
jgi:hypothetical protein